MRIAWFLDLGRVMASDDIAFAADSVMAGMRLRVGIPARELAREGVSSQLVSLAPGVSQVAWRDGAPDVAVFAKPYWYGDARDADSGRYLQAARELKARGCAIVFDQTDDLFDDPRRGYAMQMLALADAVTVSSATLVGLVHEHSGRDARLIPDPVEGVRGEPAMRARLAPWWSRWVGKKPEPARLLWYGGQVATFRALMRWQDGLARLARRQPLALSVLMDRVPEVEQGVARLVAAGVPTTRHAWSREAMARELAACDLVLLPTDHGNPRSTTASANRLLAALWAGRLPVAGAIPSYLEFSRHAWVGDNPAQGIEWALAHPSDALVRVVGGQERAEREFSPAAIGAQWRALLGNLGK
jgi:hypothetical protein